MEQLSPQLMHKLVFTVLMHGLSDAQTGLAFRLLTDALNHPNPQIRELAIVALSDLSIPPAKRVQTLAPAMADESSRVRRRAARALGDQGAAAQGALAQLTTGLGDPDVSVRRDCAGAIGRLGPTAHTAAAGLIPMLTEWECRTRAVAAVALKRMGRAAVPALLVGLRDLSAEVRAACAVLLGKIAPTDPDVVAALREAAADGDDELTWISGPSSGVYPTAAGV